MFWLVWERILQAHHPLVFWKHCIWFINTLHPSLKFSMSPPFLTSPSDFNHTERHILTLYVKKIYQVLWQCSGQMCHCHPPALCRKRRRKRIWHRLRPAYKWGPRALPGFYGFGSLCSRPALTRWCSGATLGQAAEEKASSESCKKSHLGSPASLRSFF